MYAVFRRNLLCHYQLKAKTSRAVYNEVSARYPTMPFCARTLDSVHARLAIKVVHMSMVVLCMNSHIIYSV